MAQEMQSFLNELESWGAEPKQALEDSFLGDTAFYLSCLKSFSEEVFLQTLKEDLAAGKIDEAIRAVHTMKGNADYLGLFPVMDAAMAVLEDLRAGLIAQANADIPKLEAVFARFTTMMAPYIL